MVMVFSLVTPSPAATAAVATISSGGFEGRGLRLQRALASCMLTLLVRCTLTLLVRYLDCRGLGRLRFPEDYRLP